MVTNLKQCSSLSVKWYGTKTEYNYSFVHECDSVDGDTISLERCAAQIVNLPRCQIKHVSGLLRHGSRYPSKNSVINMLEFWKQIELGLKDKDSVSLKTNFTEAHDSALAENGKNEHYGIGRRVAKLFEDLLKTASLDEVDFLSTRKSRTTDSGRAFQRGVDDYLKTSFSVDDVEVRDDLLRYYDACRQFSTRLKSKVAKAELVNFKKHPDFVSLAAKLQNALSLSTPLVIDADMVNAIYSIMAIEDNLFGYSPWKHYFNDQDLLLLEYAHDLKNYWLRSYGHDLNYQQACPLMANIFLNMDKVINGESGHKKAIFRFAHSETFLPLLALLGVFKDTQPLRADNFAEQQNRLFRTSVIGPFSANVFFVLHECDLDPEVKSTHSEVNDPPGHTYKLQLLFKERLINFPICDSNVCDYDTVRQHYSEFIDNCQFESMCAPGKNGKHEEL